ncbi:MAG TPA: fumarylacetoacetate hydrolase family protein [Candidatus Sulfotelmatobacter sp.]|nr:fumarylacetoacetate hydrolase family protein [Candidatus Sulfotelmatobacter sp.]
MKLVRFGAAGSEKPGLLDSSGKIRDLSGHIKDLTPDHLSPAGLKKLAGLKINDLPVPSGNPRLGVPYAGIGKIVAIGLNYRDHAAEVGAKIPDEPVIFMKATSSLTGPNDPVTIPKGSEKCDWEVELAVVIGTEARYVDKAKALDYVAGYTICNDVSERHFQTERGGQWTKGKCCDSFAPVGPFLATKDEIADVQKLKMFCDVNGERMQDSSTANMIFPVDFIIHYLTQFMSLQPGDLIITGTPAGVGLGKKPHPRFLKAGETMKLGVEGLGEQTQKLVAHGK